MSWKKFKKGAPELAAYGIERFSTNNVSYLATVRKDNSPRVHPVTPFISEQNLFLFMYDSSPKGKDLVHIPRYQLHASVEDSQGGGGEFYLRGSAQQVMEDEALWGEAEDVCPYSVRKDYVLFVLEIDFAFGMKYGEEKPEKMRWVNK